MGGRIALQFATRTTRTSLTKTCGNTAIRKQKNSSSWGISNIISRPRSVWGERWCFRPYLIFGRSCSRWTGKGETTNILHKCFADFESYYWFHLESSYLAYWFLYSDIFWSMISSKSSRKAMNPFCHSFSEGNILIHLPGQWALSASRKARFPK